LDSESLPYSDVRYGEPRFERLVASLAPKDRRSVSAAMAICLFKSNLGEMIEQRDIAVWAASALLAIGLGWSRYAKTKSRNDLLRKLAGMDPEVRKKMLSRFNPAMAMELRQELLERFRIMC
jgi:hypothetical protein